jgi:hypothetical protein
MLPLVAIPPICQAASPLAPYIKQELSLAKDAGTRVSLDSVVHAFLRGESPGIDGLTYWRKRNTSKNFNSVYLCT